MQEGERSPATARRLVLLGPPGAGKGTQAVRLRDRFGLSHISTGELFRQAVQDGDDLGKLVERYMLKGELVPDHTVIRLVQRSVNSLPEDPRFVLDGVPRNLAQARRLTTFLNGKRIPIQAAIHLDLDEEALVERLSGRRECPSCGRIYNLQSNPPQLSNLCDADEIRLVHRPDDQADVIRKRLQVYKAITAPVIEFYDNLDICYRVDADRPEDQVFEQLVAIIRARRTAET